MEAYNNNMIVTNPRKHFVEAITMGLVLLAEDTTKLKHSKSNNRQSYISKNMRNLIEEA